MPPFAASENQNASVRQAARIRNPIPGPAKNPGQPGYLELLGIRIIACHRRCFRNASIRRRFVPVSPPASRNATPRGRAPAPRVNPERGDERRKACATGFERGESLRSRFVPVSSRRRAGCFVFLRSAGLMANCLLVTFTGRARRGLAPALRICRPLRGHDSVALRFRCRQIVSECAPTLDSDGTGR